jgi:hypothetical protein
MNLKSLFFFSAAAISLASCNTVTLNDTGQALAYAPTMFVHVSPDAPPVDIRVNNALALQRLPYPVNTGYQNLASGASTIDITSTDRNRHLFDTTVELEGHQHYSFFIVDSAGRQKYFILSDTLATPASGQALLRYLQLTPDTAAIDLGIVGAATLFANRRFNDQQTRGTLARFRAIPAGSYALEARKPGTDTVTRSLPTFTFVAGKHYTLITRGGLNGTGSAAPTAQLIVNE